MIKGTIHKKYRHHKPLDTLTTKKQRRTIREKKKYIIIVRHINISLSIFYQALHIL